MACVMCEMNGRAAVVKKRVVIWHVGLGSLFLMSSAACYVNYLC